MKRVVIVGATSAIAEHCARLWAAQGQVQFILVARDESKAHAIAQDLRVRGSDVSTSVQTVDFTDAKAIAALAQRLGTEGPLDRVLIAHGILPDQADCQRDLDLTASSLQINAVSPALFAEAFANVLAKQGNGTLAIIGSVAGDRGRRSNYTYGAAKALLAVFAEGLRHRFANTTVRVVLIKPGPTATPMTAGLAIRGRLADVRSVAGVIVRGVDAGTPVVYAPGLWRTIMLVIRHLPNRVFDRMNI